MATQMAAFRFHLPAELLDLSTQPLFYLTSTSHRKLGVHTTRPGSEEGSGATWHHSAEAQSLQNPDPFRASLHGPASWGFLLQNFQELLGLVGTLL